MGNSTSNHGTTPAAGLGSVAEKLGLSADLLHPYGTFAAKVDLAAMDRPRKSGAPSKLILVTAITPTPAGEGKTTTSIGLSDALASLGKSVCAALREPSLGPCFGIKGGGTGGGKCQLYPMERINLHFTGDFHAITSAHNLLSATIDNHMHFGSEPYLDPRRVVWPRVIDMNDRSLRNVTVGKGGKTQGMPRETGFDITAASELMAMLCLTDSFEDLRARIDRSLIAIQRDGTPIPAKTLGVTGSMLALMRDTLMPNLVRTLSGTPALVHGGPFANIAHGCNSVIATKMAMHLADYTITEAGFGCDLGAEKFFDIKARAAGLDVAAVVLVASIRALKMHGGVPVADLEKPDAQAVSRGLANLEKHIENVGHFGKRAVVAINRFGTDTEDELQVVTDFCKEGGHPVALCEHFAKGAAGATDLAKAVIEAADQPSDPFTPIYPLEASVKDKIEAVATRIYGASGVSYSKAAERDLKQIDRLGFAGLPICVAKTQNSLSDDPTLRGRPSGFTLTVRNIQINAGAGFLVVLTGDMLRMPGLPRSPQALRIDLEDGEIVGLR